MASSNCIFNKYKRVEVHFIKLVVHFGYISFCLCTFNDFYTSGGAAGQYLPKSFF